MGEKSNILSDALFPFKSNIAEGVACIVISIILNVALYNVMPSMARSILLGLITLVGILITVMGCFYFIKLEANEISVQYIGVKKVLNIDDIRMVQVKTHYSVERVPTFLAIIYGSNEKLKIVCKANIFYQIESFLNQHEISIVMLRPQLQKGSNCKPDDRLCDILTYRLRFVEKYLPVGCALSVVLSAMTYITEYNTAIWLIIANSIWLGALFSNCYDVFSTNVDDYGSVAQLPKSIWSILDIRTNKILIIEVVVSLGVYSASLVMKALELIVIQDNGISELTFFVLLLGVGPAYRKLGEENRLSEAVHCVLFIILMLYLMVLGELVNWTIAEQGQIPGKVSVDNYTGKAYVAFEYDGEHMEYWLMDWERYSYSDNESVQLYVHNNPYGEVMLHIKD